MSGDADQLRTLFWQDTPSHNVVLFILGKSLLGLSSEYDCSRLSTNKFENPYSFRHDMIDLHVRREFLSQARLIRCELIVPRTRTRN
jgi:hypothetical protein